MITINEFSTKEEVLAAVRQKGYALNYASEALREDRKFVLAAVAQNVQALRYVSETLRNDKEFVFAAIALNSEAIQFAPRYIATFVADRYQEISNTTSLLKDLVIMILVQETGVTPEGIKSLIKSTNPRVTESLRSSGNHHSLFSDKPQYVIEERKEEKEGKESDRKPLIHSYSARTYQVF